MLSCFVGALQSKVPKKQYSKINGRQVIVAMRHGCTLVEFQYRDCGANVDWVWCSLTRCDRIELTISHSRGEVRRVNARVVMGM